MAIRAFITTWSLDTGAVTNPITAFIDARGETRQLELLTYAPSTTIDGVPDKNRLLVILRSTEIQASELEQLGALSGVRLVPPFPFSTPIADIPAAIRLGIRNAILAEGIPLEALANINTWGDFLRRVAKYFNVSFNNFGRSLEIDLADEFG